MNTDGHVGFTGTREGMTDAQKVSVKKLLHQLRIGYLHHGDCVGSDAEVHELATELGIRVWLHPPVNSKLRAYCSAFCSEEPAPYATRNMGIVKACNTIIATPKSGGVARGGTWMTIGFAKRLKRRVLLVHANGFIEGHA